MNPRDGQVLRATLEQLRREVEDVCASRKRLVLTADADRRRIEHDLHDGVQQHLVALTVNLQLAERLTGSDPRAASELIAEMARDVQQTLDETARLAQRIYPPLLEARGLGAALRAAATHVHASARIEVADAAGWAPEVAAAAYLGILDVLEQIREDSSVTISVREENGELVITIIEDDTRSALSETEFDQLRDRLEAFGGQLTVVSEPGLGTQVSGSLPLRP